MREVVAVISFLISVASAFYSLETSRKLNQLIFRLLGHEHAPGPG